MAYVYRHIRLDKNEPFYIGIGSAKNFARAYAKNNRNIHWQRIVAKTDYEVEILFDNLSNEDARTKEIEFIRLYGRDDLKTGSLVNLTDGGDGTLNKVLSPELIEKIRNSNKGKKYSEEHKKRLSEIHKERLKDPEKRKQLSISITGSKHKVERSLAHRQKIAENNRKRVYTEETRKKMSEAAKLRMAKRYNKAK